MIYTSSKPVVIHLVPLPHRVHSVPVWLVAVMREQGGDGGFLPSPQPDRGTAPGQREKTSARHKRSVCLPAARQDFQRTVQMSYLPPDAKQSNES